MAVNKVTYGGETLIDLTGDTVTADTLAKGVTAHDASGAEIIGTMVASAQKVMTGTYNGLGYTSVSIEHGLGTTPNFAIIYQTNSYTTISSRPRVIVHANQKNNSSMNSVQVWKNNYTMQTSANASVTMDETTVTFNSGDSNMQYMEKYGYVIGVI